jgi:DNA-binding NarL/FixJ family response regulator
MYSATHRPPSRHLATARDAGLRVSAPTHARAPLSVQIQAPVAIAILAEDPMIGQGATAYLRGRPEVKVLPVERQSEAEVVVVLAGMITEHTLERMEAMACARSDAGAGSDSDSGARPGGTRFVLVGDGAREHHVLRAVAFGMVSVIPRREADFDRIVAAILDVRDGRLELPTAAVGWLAQRLRSIQHDILEPHGLTCSGLETREVDVLRLLAEGMGTPEIATKLCYSERTVKNIIHGVLTRLQLRNRTQAVAYAVKSGAL